MRELILGGAVAFGLMVINKAVVEPLAKNVGRRVLEKYVGPCCERLDYLMQTGLPDYFRSIGMSFDFEEQVREFLDMSPETLSDEDVTRIVEEVFRVYDLRLIDK